VTRRSILTWNYHRIAPRYRTPGISEILRGGFPDSFLAPDHPSSPEWRAAFVRTYLERDIPSLGPRVPAETLQRFRRMLTHEQGQLHNAARIAAGLGISGLVHALVGILGLEELLGHPVVGPSWEGFVIESLLAAVPPECDASSYRTSAGAGIDLLLDWGKEGSWAIEVKRSLSSPASSTGSRLTCGDVKASRRFVVYPGRERYRLARNTEVISLPGLLEGEITRRVSAVARTYRRK